MGYLDTLGVWGERGGVVADRVKKGDAPRFTLANASPVLTSTCEVTECGAVVS